MEKVLPRLKRKWATVPAVPPTSKSGKRVCKAESLGPNYFQKPLWLSA